MMLTDEARRALNVPVTAESLRTALHALGETDVAVTIVVRIRHRRRQDDGSDLEEEVQQAWDAETFNSMKIGAVDLAESVQAKMQQADDAALKTGEQE